MTRIGARIGARIGSRIGAIATLFGLVCTVAGVAGAKEDGIPRPANFADEPTTSYGPDPVLTQAGTPADCAWYGFSNSLYPESTIAACQATLRTALTNETSNPASELRPFNYYTLIRLIDPATNESYCYQGCYKLASATPPIYVRGPALEPIYFDGPVAEPVMAPMYYDGPSMVPLSDSPDGTSPAMSPGN